jgi:hypothetical protein
MILVHSSLSEAVKAGHVARFEGDFSISNAYWNWCTANAKPYVAITVRPKSRYADVELDLYNTTDVGFGSEAGYEILHFILGQPLKPRSTFFVSPTLIQLSVVVSSAGPVAEFLYRSAIDERILFTQEDLVKRLLDRLGKSETLRRSFKPFSALVHPTVLAEMYDPNFWKLMVS